MFKRLLLLVKPYWKRLAVAAAASLFVSAMNGGLAWMVKPALDGVFLKRDAALLALLPLGVMALFVLRGGFIFCQAYLMRSISAKLVRDIRTRLYEHLLTLPVDEFKKESSASIISRVINDASLLQNFLANGVKDLFVEGATVVVLIAVAVSRKWDLALIAFIVLPLGMSGARRFGKRLKTISKESQKKIGLVTELLTETFGGIKMIKVFGREDALQSLFRNRNQEYYRDVMRSTRISEGTSLMMDVVGGVGVAFVLWYGGRFVIQGVITPGDFFSFLAAIFMVYTPAKRVANAHNNIQQAKAVMERLDELFHKTGEAEGKEDLSPLKE
ncbi:MAG: ABC transporter transmembrane domain-containing protein, partial [Thermodesulfovibrionales bacterium]